MSISLLFLLLCSVAHIVSFQAYDCTHPHSLGIYKLTAEQECVNILENASKTDSKEGTLIQMPAYYVIKGKLLTTLRKIDRVYCTYYRSRTMRMIPEAYIDFVPFKLSRGEGLNLLHTGSVRLDNKLARVGLNEDTIVVTGQGVDSEGYCVSYSSKLDVTIYKLRLEEVEIRVRIGYTGFLEGMSLFEEDIEEWDLKGFGYLGDGSMVMWNPRDIRACPWERVFSGVYEEFVTKSNTTVALFNQIGASIILKGQKYLCGQHVLSTNNDRLYMLGGLHQTDINISDLGYGSWSTLILSTVQFVENLQVKLLNNLTKVIAFNECKLNAKLLNEIVYGAKTSPEQIGYKLTGKYGTLAIISGAALHLMVCRNVEVKLRDTDSCYTEIPVTMINGTIGMKDEYFIDPITRVLSDSSTRLSCSDVRNPYFSIRGSYYKLGPKLQLVPKPKNLPEVLKSLIAVDTTDIKGLYPHELTEKMESTNAFHMRKKRVMNQFINLVGSDVNVQEGSLLGTWELFDTMGYRLIYGFLSLNLIWTLILTLFTIYNNCYGNRNRATVEVNVVDNEVPAPHYTV